MYSSNISSHLKCLLEPGKLASTIKYCIERLEEISQDVEFDAIAVSGYSGSLIVAPIALALNKNIILVRKDDEVCYSKFQVEGPMDGRYIILDDLICTGRTVSRIVRKIKQHLTPYAECNGAYLWHDDFWCRKKSLSDYLMD